MTKDFSKLDKILLDKSCTLLYSKELYEEFQEVAERPKFRKYFSLTDLSILLSEIRHKGLMISVSSKVETCRDSKDNFLLSLAKDGNATHLLTGDKDLLTLKRSGRTKILSIRDFLLKISK